MKKYWFGLRYDKGEVKVYYSDSSYKLKQIRSQLTKNKNEKILITNILKGNSPFPALLTVMLKNNDKKG